MFLPDLFFALVTAILSLHLQQTENNVFKFLS